MEETTTTDATKSDRFVDCYHYLTSWFQLLGPAHLEDESKAHLSDVPPFEVRLDSMHALERVTENSLATGVPLPFEEFIRQNEMDLVDRLILLALLREALDPLSDGGVPLIKIMWALGADHVGRQWEIRRRLDVVGDLRDSAIIECAPSPDLLQCRYRLAHRYIEYLTTGEGDNRGLPRIPENRLEALDALQYDTRQLIEAVKLAPHEAGRIWHGVRKGNQGWDWTVLRRNRLAARLQATYRQNDFIGAEIRRLKLDRDEQLAWSLLFFDSSAEQVGLAVPFVLTFVGRDEDAEPAAARLLGPDSKLAKAGVLRFNRNDGPLLGRVVGLSQEARSRVALWPRGAFVMKPGNGLEVVGDEQRTLGFGGNSGLQDRTASSRATAGGAS